MHRIFLFLLAAGIAGCTSGEDCSHAYSLEEGGNYERYMKAAQAWEFCPTANAEREKYRLVWLRSAHNPLVITLIKDHQKVELAAVRLDGTGASQPGEVTETRNRMLTPEEFARFQVLLDRADFWNLKSRRQLIRERSSDAGGEDSRWMLEGADEHRAHAADRGSNVQGPFRELALYLLQTSQIGLNGEIY